MASGHELRAGHELGASLLCVWPPFYTMPTMPVVWTSCPVVQLVPCVLVGVTIQSCNTVVCSSGYHNLNSQGGDLLVWRDGWGKFLRAQLACLYQLTTVLTVWIHPLCLVLTVFYYCIPCVYLLRCRCVWWRTDIAWAVRGVRLILLRCRDACGVKDSQLETMSVGLTSCMALSVWLI